MLTGRKPGTPDQAVRSAWRGLAVLMLAATLGFWAWQWHSSPGGAAPMASGAAEHAHDQGDDD
jgi:hypothetical protein